MDGSVKIRIYVLACKLFITMLLFVLKRFETAGSWVGARALAHKECSPKRGNPEVCAWVTKMQESSGQRGRIIHF